MELRIFVLPENGWERQQGVQHEVLPRLPKSQTPHQNRSLVLSEASLAAALAMSTLKPFLSWIQSYVLIIAATHAAKLLQTCTPCTLHVACLKENNEEMLQNRKNTSHFSPTLFLHVAFHNHENDNGPNIYIFRAQSHQDLCRELSFSSAFAEKPEQRQHLLFATHQAVSNDMCMSALRGRHIQQQRVPKRLGSSKLSDKKKVKARNKKKSGKKHKTTLKQYHALECQESPCCVLPLRWTLQSNTKSSLD